MPADPRAAIVTGASSGVGFAIAQVLAEAGHALTLSARRPDKLESAALALKQYDVLSVAGDLADEPTVTRLVQAHAHRWGRLDVLVNAAAVAGGGFDTRRVNEQLHVNLRAPILLYRECAGLLDAAPAALVVNVAPMSELPVHAATTAGLAAFTQAMNRDGVRSIVLTPDRDSLHTRDVADAVKAML